MDNVLKDFEKDNGPVTVSPDDSLESEKMEVDMDPDVQEIPSSVSPTPTSRVPLKTTGKIAVSAGQANKW